MHAAPVLRRALLACLCASAGTLVSAQTVYKVVGPDGRVTYTNQPPVDAKARVTTVDVQGGTTVPAWRAPPAPAKDTAPESKARDELVRQQIETEKARQRAYDAEAERRRAEIAQLEAAREECERQRWADCDDPQRLAERGWVVGPTWGHRHGPRPPPRPLPPPPPGPRPLPPGAIPHQAPADQYLPRAYPPVPAGTPGYPR